jgi:hypothetical protein
MGLFDKVFGTNKIKVQFIDNSTGQILGVSEMQADQLPETFSAPTTMHIQDSEWSVEKATPESSVDFIKSKQLVLKLRKIEKINLQDILYTLPTISNEIPQTVDNSKYNDFKVSIHEDDWRQKEFLKPSSFPLVDIEVSKIKDILTNESKQVNNSFTGFKNCHARSTIGAPDLSIDFEELKNLLNVSKVGGLKVNNEYVQDSFSLQTEHTTFYGTVANDKITQFCISDWSANTHSEILKVVNQFDLIFIHWYRCDIITGRD